MESWLFPQTVNKVVPHKPGPWDLWLHEYVVRNPDIVGTQWYLSMIVKFGRYNPSSGLVEDASSMTVNSLLDVA